MMAGDVTIEAPRGDRVRDTVHSVHCTVYTVYICKLGGEAYCSISTLTVIVGR